MMSMAACSPVRGIEAFDQDKIVLLQMEDMVEGEDIAVVTTSEGTFKMRFFPSEAPKTVENFISLAQEHYYDGKMISQVEKIPQDDRVKSRMIIGTGLPSAEPGITVGNRHIKPEISYNLGTIPGAVAAYAPEGVVDSRFYIVGSRKVYQEELDEIAQNNYPKDLIRMFRKHGGYPEEWLHESVFAQVVEGMDVVDRIIENSSCTPKDEVTDVEIISIIMEQYSGEQDLPSESEEKNLSTSITEEEKLDFQQDFGYNGKANHILWIEGDLS